MNNINILHLRSSGGFFGAEGVILNLVQELVELGIDNRIVCLNNPRDPHIELVEEAKKNGLKAEDIISRGKLDLKTILQVRALLKKYKINILHCHDYKTNFLGFFATRGLKISIVTTNHLWTQATTSLRFYESLDGYIIRFFNRVIAVSDSIKNEILKRGVPQSKVITINNGINLQGLNRISDGQNLRMAFGISQNSAIVGTVGRLSVEKGHTYLLEAAKGVIKVIPDAKFLVVGEGPLREELTAKSGKLGIGANVIFTGMRRDMADVYDLLDLCVSSSLREGLPLVILEALAMERAVIATDVGGVSGIIENGKTGILLKPTDVEGLSRAIVSLLRDKQKREIFGRNGRKLVEQRFSAKVMASKYKQVYEELLGK